MMKTRKKMIEYHMLNMVLAFLAGLVVMDFAWAYRFGMPQRLFRLLKNRIFRLDTRAKK